MPTPSASPQPDPRPLILTALLEPAAQARFEALRRAHFPPGRNQVPAHVTLFHHLPGRELEAVRMRLKRLCADTPPPQVAVIAPQFTGNGTAFRLRSPELEAIRADLAEVWETLLIPQDRLGWRAHITVQNKADAATAKRTHAELAAAFAPSATRVVALALWRYLDGPWEPLGQHPFRGR